MVRTVSLTLISLLITSVGLRAQPLEFAFQGRLLDTGGVPISEATSVFFSLWQGGNADTADSGALAYSELAAVTPDATGIFVHHVGTGSALDATTLEAADFDFAGDIFVQVAVGTQANVLLPRTRLSSAPYAIQALTAATASQAATASSADSAIDSDQLGGQPPSYYLDRANHTGAIALGDLPERVGSIWLPAWTFAPESRQAQSDGEIHSNYVFPTLLFKETFQDHAMTVVSLPADFAPGPIRYNLVHSGEEDPTPGSDQVRWSLYATSLTSVSAASVSGVYSTIPAADEVVVLTVESTSTLDDGQAVGIKILRNALLSVVDDTYEHDVEVLGLRIDYTRAPEAF